MTLHDFFQEKITPFFKGDYQNFSSKAVDGYSLFIAQWDKSPRQAMITFDTQAQLQRIFEKYSAFTDSKEGDLQSSQISRWYVNGFTLAYNYCRRYDLDHLYEHTDFVQLAEKLKSSDNVNRGNGTLICSANTQLTLVGMRAHCFMWPRKKVVVDKWQMGRTANLKIIRTISHQLYLR